MSISSFKFCCSCLSSPSKLQFFIIGCTLRIEYGNGSSTNAFTADGHQFYSLNIVTETGKPMCGETEKSIAESPISVRDYQNQFIWNVGFTSDFMEEIKFAVIEDGLKVNFFCYILFIVLLSFNPKHIFVAEYPLKISSIFIYIIYLSAR